METPLEVSTVGIITPTHNPYDFAFKLLPSVEYITELAPIAKWLINFNGEMWPEPQMGNIVAILRDFGLKDNLYPAIMKMKEFGLSNDIVEMIDQSILDRFSLCGSIESNIERLVNYQQIGVDTVVFGPPQGASLDGVKRIVDAKSRF